MNQLILNGKTFDLTRESYSIGRGDDCDILLPENDAVVSRKHALLELARDGTWVLTDLNSTNGTYLHGKRIAGQTDLSSGASFTIGKSEFKILFDSPKAAEPAAIVAPEAIAPQSTPTYVRPEFDQLAEIGAKPETISRLRSDLDAVETSDAFEFKEIDLRPQTMPPVQESSSLFGSAEASVASSPQFGYQTGEVDGHEEGSDLKSVIVKAVCALPAITLIIPWVQASVLEVHLQGTYLRIFLAMVQDVLPDRHALESAPGLLVLLLPMPIALASAVGLFIHRKSVKPLIITAGIAGLVTSIVIYGYLSNQTVSLTQILGPGFYLFAFSCLVLVLVGSSSLCSRAGRR